MAKTRAVNAVSRMRRNLFCTSVLSGGLMLVAVPEVMAGCVETSNSTVCSEGASTLDIILPNASYTSGNYDVVFDNYLLNSGGGLSLSDVVGSSNVTLSNGSMIDGGVFASFNEAAIYVKGSGAGSIDVNLQDSSSVHSTGNGIQVSSDNFSATSDVTVTTGSGSVVGDDGYGIYAGAWGSDVTVNVNGEVSGGLAGIAASSLVGNVSITTSDAAVSSKNYWGIWGDTSRDISIVAGGDVTGTQGIVATGSGGAVNISTAAGHVVRGTEGAGLIANGSDIHIEARSKIFGEYYGIYSYGFGGNTTVETYDSVSSNSSDGIAVYSTSFEPLYYVSVYSEGEVVGGNGGILVGAYNGDIAVETKSLIEGKSGAGIKATVGLGSSFGSGDVSVETNGDVLASQSGIVASTRVGNVDIFAGGNVTGGSGSGINAKTAVGNINIETAENKTVRGVMLSGPSDFENGVGIHARVEYSGVGVDNSIAILANGDVIGDSFGIWANSHSDTINIVTQGAVNGITRAGIFASSVTGQSTIVETSGNVEGGTTGIEAYSDGLVHVKTDADVVGHYGDGIYANAGTYSYLSNAGVLVETAANHLVKGDNGFGIVAHSNYSGDNKVVALGDVVGLGGILASANRGNVEIVTGTGSIEAVAYAGIYGQAKQDLTLISASKITGSEGAGINVSNAIGLLDVNLIGSSSVSSLQNAGIVAVSQSGDINIHTAENTSIEGLGGNGITAFNTEAGDVLVSALGSVFGSVSGIYASSEDGIVDVTFGTGTITGQTADGVFLGGTTSSNLTNNGTIRGLEHGVLSFSMGANVITNNGLIENLNIASDALAIGTDYSAASLTNSATGKILGRVELSVDAFDDSFINQGLWQSTGLSEFGAGADMLSNSGTVRFSGTSNVSENTTYSGLETFESSGLLSGIDQASGDGSTSFDSLSLSGDYIGAAGAVVALDVYLGGPGSLADVVSVDGNTSGQTLLRLNNTNSGGGSINDVGIVLVEVAGTSSASDFALEGGPVTNGLYAYEIEYRAGEAGASFALVSAPSAQAGELVELVDGLQNIWTGSMNAWSLRQATLRDVIAGRTRITAASSEGLAESAGVQQVWASPRGEWSKRETVGAFGSTAHRQSTYGIDGGVDFAVDVAPDVHVLFGLVGGYATSDVNFVNSASGIDIEGGSLGAYVGFVSHGFFADALLKHDWMDLDYTAAGAGSANTDARSLGLAADVGYRFGNGASFVEPLVSFSMIETQADDFTLSGSLVSPGKNTATRVGAGVRFGVNEGVFNSLFTLRAWESLGGENQLGFGTAALPIVGSSHSTTIELSSQLSVDVSERAKVFVNGTTYLSNDETAASLTAGLTAQF